MLNPNRAGLLDDAWERGGGWISPHLLDHPKTLWKTKKFFFDFLKVHNELGKVTKFGGSRTHFSWRNGRLKKVLADSTPPPTSIGLRDKKLSNVWCDAHWHKRINMCQCVVMALEEQHFMGYYIFNGLEYIKCELPDRSRFNVIITFCYTTSSYSC